MKSSAAAIMKLGEAGLQVTDDGMIMTAVVAAACGDGDDDSLIAAHRPHQVSAAEKYCIQIEITIGNWLTSSRFGCSRFGYE